MKKQMPLQLKPDTKQYFENIRLEIAYQLRETKLTHDAAVRYLIDFYQTKKEQ